MVGGGDLKNMHRHIEADEAEMAVYRNALGAHLKQTAQPRAFAWWWFALPTAAALALIAVLSLYPRQQPEWLLDQTPEQLLSRIDASDQAFIDQAHGAFSENYGIAQANARLLVMHFADEAKAMKLAYEGINKDPRPDFRSFYLEWMLDRADSYVWNQEVVESLMEKEDDPLCLALYNDFLDIT